MDPIRPSIPSNALLQIAKAFFLKNNYQIYADTYLFRCIFDESVTMFCFRLGPLLFTLYWMGCAAPISYASSDL